jgi:hypothetical protein
MATRMTTLLYGEKPEADIAPGNRADAEIDPGDSGTHPRLLPTVELKAAEPVTRPTPTSPEPSPWVAAKPVAFPSLELGLAAVAAIFGGLAMLASTLAWPMTSLARIGLAGLGGYCIAIGIAIIMSVPSQSPRAA